MISELLLFAISILPVILIGLFIFKKDRDKEPFNILIKLFFGGIASCFLVIIVSSFLETFFPFFGMDTSGLNLVELLVYVFVGVALIEEGCKWFVAYKISYQSIHFDELYDMIIYCVFVALGFACFENLFYVYQGGIKIGLLRAILAVPGHACDGLFMGYYLGLAKINEVNGNKSLKTRNMLLSILVPTFTHGVYDYCLFTSEIPFLVFFFLFVIAVYIISLKRVQKVSSLDGKFKYRNNFCPHCGHAVDSNFCPNCGRKNE